ncbi:MAG: valine--tRNA ligase, partial [Candidatus Eremiobacteraeota bacterium]|nr:valine--tRNA ligase [Candidatus Eremiobacteraeota bacterium]
MTVSNLSKAYEPQAVEQRHYAAWEQAGFFHEEPDPARPPYIICMPPPNVTARAHIGHGSTYIPMDILVRYHRMMGENADWLPGTDHAAIATETVLVRQLAAEGKSRESLGREQYMERAWRWSRETGGTINDQFRRLGFGPDWDRSRFTMDDSMSAAVTRVFVELYREGLIYRGTRLINWDPKSKSTISDAEIDHEERPAFLWRVRYPFSKDASDGIEIATTRPETMLADVAIAVHPEDTRYTALIGKTVLVPPLMQRAIPIIADSVVDPEFGTGAVKVTPAHDATDYDIGTRHALATPSVIDTDGNITGNDLDVGRFLGLESLNAREEIVKDIAALGLLIEKQPYTHSVAISERSGAIVEPLLSLQWFIDMKPLAKPALNALHDGRLRFVPERYGRTYEQWLENIRDWNISRQVWWGHQLPVWYTPNDDVIVAHTEEEAKQQAREKFGSDMLRRDSDTLDTWFSSGLWPFSILGWPQKTPELAHWY